MPQIRSYDAGQVGLRPTETGVEAAAAAGRRLGAFFNQKGGAMAELGRDQQRLGSETAALGRETGEAYGRLGRETADLGVEKGRALAVTGRAVGSGIADAGTAAVNYITHKEISAGAVTIANFAQAKTQEWNDTVKNADPNDPSIAPSFRERLEPDLDKIRSSFTTEKGQQWAEAHVDSLRNHFFQKTAADMSTLAAQAVAVNHQQTVNSLSATVHGDPSSLDFALSTLEGATIGTVASSPNLTGTAAARVHGELMQKGKEAIIKSAAIGYIQNTGKMPAWLDDPKYSGFVNGAELKQFQKYAEVQQRTNLAYEKSAAAFDRAQAQERATAAVNKTFTDNVTIDEGTGRPIIKPNFFKDVLKVVQDNPDAPNAATLGRAYLNWGESQLRARTGAVQSDPNVKQGLVDRMMDPDHPTTKVDLMQAQIDGKLSNQDFASMSRLVGALEKEPLRDPVFKATMDGAKSTIGTDPVGKGKYAQFVQDFLPKYQAAKRAGTLEPNALDLRNPDSMISKAMQPYRRDPATLMTDRIMRTDTTQPAGVTGGGGLEAGTVRNGWRFKGGDPSSRENWERVQGAPVVPMAQ